MRERGRRGRGRGGERRGSKQAGEKGREGSGLVSFWTRDRLY